MAGITLPPDEIHVWTILQDRPFIPLERLTAWLSADERHRAACFRAERQQRRFIVGRGALRWILGQYAGIAPERLIFAYGPYGRPELAGGALRFNLSHSDGLALLAVTGAHRQVGIDIERISDGVDMEPFAARFFSAHERGVLELLPLPARLQAFFNAWTRKEAYLKATGEGISLPLAEVEVTLTPGDCPRLVGVPSGHPPAAAWRLAALNPAPGFAGALVADSPQWQVRMQGEPSGR